MTVLDAVVIGGGPGGSATALLLAQAGWSVAIIEQKAFPRRKVCGEYLSATNLPLLDRLGVGNVFRQEAGPPVRKVGLFTDTTVLEAGLPPLGGTAPLWGRALSRERLDTLLLERAHQAGAQVHQPWKALTLVKENDVWRCALQAVPNGTSAMIEAGVVVAAHGSWDAGTLPSQPPRRPPLASDLLGFKMHFRGSTLAADLMPLLAFPGGYGGMVHCEDGRVSLSCCVRRDRLAALRQGSPGDAGAAVLRHIRQHCRGADEVLGDATEEDAWLAAGPIRPGIRVGFQDEILLVGNAAGEAHPVIAEGISIALQSAWLLASRLIAWKQNGEARTALKPLAASYAGAWRRHFAPRLYASQLIAQWAMRPAAVACVRPLLRAFPAALTWGARLSGKAHGIMKDSPQR